MTKNTFKKWKEEDAIEEWKAFTDDKFYTFVKILLADKKSPLNHELQDASLNWDRYSWPMKCMLFNRLKTYYMDVFKVDTVPMFYTIGEWNIFCAENGYDMPVEDDGRCYCIFLKSTKTTYFINKNEADFEGIGFFPSIRNLAYDLATDFTYQKIYPVLDGYDPDNYNIILVHKDPHHRLKKALGQMLTYNAQKNISEDHYAEYLSFHNRFQGLFASEMVISVREILWHMEGQYNHLAMFNMIKGKSIEMIQYCEDMAKKYGLKEYSLPYEVIEKLPVYQSKEEFKDQHYEYRQVIDEVAKRCADIAATIMQNHDEKLSKKDKYDLEEVLPFFTALFSITKYKWSDDKAIE